LITLPKTLLARSFLLMVILIMLSFAAFVAIFGILEQQPRARQMAQLVISVVNLTRAAVLSAAPEWRGAMLSELAESEGIRVHMAETGDVLEALPVHPAELQLMAQKVRDQLGSNTRFASKRNGMDALWVSFFIGEQEFWVALPKERIEYPVSQVLLLWGWVVLALALLGAYFIARQVALPLKRLAKAAHQLGQGATPVALPENGAQEIKAVARAFNQMSADLKAHERERALVLAGISHDLRTPLARVRLAAELCADETLRDGLILDVEQMDAVIRQFLDYARLDANESSEVSGLRPNEIAVLTDLVALVRETALQFAAQARLTLDLQPIPPFAVRPMLLQRALSNLLDNAVKYGGGEITVQLRHVERKIELMVMDRGAGIPAAHREAAKRPFVRLQSARCDATGSGLGLAIVERVTRMHGGEFLLEERPGGGLVAKLVLPAAQ
jgi:two-component system, OmpR family, osmolarity sensor histidine kinase EnvZ